jgi:serine/threonine-protein kinase
VDGQAKATEHFEEAISIAPDYADALADLSLAIWLQASFFTQASSIDALKASRDRALGLAERAVRLDETLADPHATLGWFRFWNLDWAAAERAFLRAIDLDPSNTRARHGYAFFLTGMTRYDEAIIQMRHTRDLNPASSTLATASHWPFYCARRFDEAASVLVEAATLAPTSPIIRIYLGRVRSLQGRHEEAFAAFDTAIRLGAADTPRLLAAMAGAYASANRYSDAQRVLAELTAAAARSHINPIWLAKAHAVVGRREEALDWLERAYELRVKPAELTTIRDPAWDSVRAAPRFRALLDKMGVPH